MLEVEDLTLFCRVCLQLPEDSQILDVDLIYDENENLTYSECFTVCTKLDLLLNDAEPHNLCKLCGLELQMAYDFYKKVEASNRKLQEWRQLHEPVNVEFLNMKSDEPFETAEEPEQNEENEEILDVEDFQSFEEHDSEDAETIQIKIDKKCTEDDDEEDEIVTLLEHDNGAPNKNQSTWQHAVVTVANESHLPLNATEAEDNDSAEMECDNVQVYTIINANEVIDENSSFAHEIKEQKTNVKSRQKGQQGGMSGQLISCDYCKKLFPNNSRMLTHRRSHEPDRPKFPCSKCGRIYATKQAMDVHYRAVHSKTGYNCSVCGKVYAIRMGLEVHMRYHTGEFPYVCDMCGKKFAQMCHLNTHKKVQHNSARFCCDFPNCGKYFTSSASLRSHEFSHGDMPFECEFCLIGYPTKSKLKVHVRRKHGREMTLDQLEHMRKFYVMRSKLNLVKVPNSIEDQVE